MSANSTRRAVNLTVSSVLIREAKALEINLSREFEAHLSDLVKERRQERWLAEKLTE